MSVIHIVQYIRPSRYRNLLNFCVIVCRFVSLGLSLQAQDYNLIAFTSSNEARPGRHSHLPSEKLEPCRVSERRVRVKRSVERRFHSIFRFV